MEMRSLRYFVGTTAAIGLLLSAAGHAWTQAERAADGQTLAAQSAETQAMFRDTFGSDADRQWVSEHNAELTRRGQLPSTAPEAPRPPAPPEAPVPPIAMPPDTGATPTATAMGTPATATAVASPSVVVTTVATAGTGAGTSGSPGGAPTAAPAPPTMVPGAQATANALPRVGVEPTPFPRVNR
jgi:hypothetical protein